ncbi:hypothetical protein HK405_012326, partial [Cladochytrium tenue]
MAISHGSPIPGSPLRRQISWSTSPASYPPSGAFDSPPMPTKWLRASPSPATKLSSGFYQRSQSPSLSSIGSDMDLRAEGAGNRRPSFPQTRSLHETLTSINSIVKNRTGSVLARKLILKSDHFNTGTHLPQDVFLHGAPNFRRTDFNVFGVAQPTVAGIATILNLFDCRATSPGSHRTLFVSSREEPLIYINWRPFVLRENDSPFQNMRAYQGISGQRLEQVGCHDTPMLLMHLLQMEARLKEDVLKESMRFNNLLLVHDEVENGKIMPAWVALVDVMTPREVFDGMKENGFRVGYTRIPISPEQAPEDRYLD